MDTHDAVTRSATTSADAVRGPTQAAAAAVAARCLQRGRSLCAGSWRLWTAERLEDLAGRIERAAARASKPGTAAPFETRWRRMLARADNEAVALAAEVLYVHLLFPSSVSGERKRALLDATRARLPGPPTLPGPLEAALDHGVAPAGIAYTRQRLTQLAWLAAAAATVRRLPPTARTAMLADPERAAAVLHDVPVSGGGPQRAALLHLLHPDTFVPVTSSQVRRRLLRAFADHVPAGVTDPDCALAAVHAALVPEFGPAFSFFDPEVAAHWQ